MLELFIVIGRAVTLALRGHRELVLENLALREQLIVMNRATSRRHLQAPDWLSWIALRRLWTNWRTALVIVRPDTVVGWHRDWLRRRWIRRSRRRTNGRPLVSREVRTLVREMATANTLWGAPRIHGELRTLGLDISERTVSRLLKRCPQRRSQTWRTFLQNHLASAASMDFFTVPTVTGRVLFVCVLLCHHRRRIVHLNITPHPTAEWSAQQVVDAFPDATAPRWFHRDRDRVFGAAFQRRVARMGITEVVSAPASPWQNPYVERVIGSIRRHRRVSSTGSVAGHTRSTYAARCRIWREPDQSGSQCGHERCVFRASGRPCDQRRATQTAVASQRSSFNWPDGSLTRLDLCVPGRYMATPWTTAGP